MSAAVLNSTLFLKLMSEKILKTNGFECVYTIETQYDYDNCLNCFCDYMNININEDDSCDIEMKTKSWHNINLHQVTTNLNLPKLHSSNISTKNIILLKTHVYYILLYYYNIFCMPYFDNFPNINNLFSISNNDIFSNKNNLIINTNNNNNFENWNNYINRNNLSLNNNNIIPKNLINIK